MDTETTTRRAADQASSVSADLWNETRRTASSAVASQQESAAAAVRDFAGALRSAAHELEGRQKEAPARYALHAADGMDRLSQKLREKDMGEMLRDMESFARTQPALFIGAAFAAGFLATRFLKSSGHGSEPSLAQGDSDVRHRSPSQ